MKWGTKVICVSALSQDDSLLPVTANSRVRGSGLGFDGRRFIYILIKENNQHGGRKDNTIILTSGQLTISTSSGEAHV
jgi:hypothetical protein